MKRGFFITFEGTECCGKSTQVARLVERLRSKGVPVVFTREPGGTNTGEVIREILQHDKCGEPVCDESEMFLFMAGRAQLVKRVIEPALGRGDVVICDRFTDSTVAYQGYGRGGDVERIVLMNSMAVQGVNPDMTILLDIDVSAGFERLARRNLENNVCSDRIERESREFHERIRKGFRLIAKRWPERFRVIDASESPDSVESVVWEHVSALLAGGGMRV